MQLSNSRSFLQRRWGIELLPETKEFLPDEMKQPFALDAQPALLTTASSGIPFWLSTYIDPEVVRIVQTPNEGANILGEEKEGDWTTRTATFTIVENTGTVSTYGDYNAGGRSDANVNYANRQSYLFQTTVNYGDLQVDTAGLANLNWVSELQTSAAMTLDKFMDYTYHFGVSGLMNYGLLNDPNLPTALTPSTKQAGGVKWVNNGVVTAQATEIYGDLQSMVFDLVNRSGGRIKRTDPMTLVMPPQVDVALMATNIYGINVMDLLKKNFPNIKFVTSYRYATTSGNVIQLWADRFNGAKTGFAAFCAKLKDHQIVRQLSSFAQKKSSGTWGAIIKYPIAVSQMLGV